MLDPINVNLLIPVVDFVEDPVAATADAVALGVGKFLHPERSRIGGELCNAESQSLYLTCWKHV